MQNITNETLPVTSSLTLTSDDGAWILSCTFLILTMQTGFSMLESGHVSERNAANIMIKNLIDVSVGGVAFWIFGYGLAFGRSWNGFVGTDMFLFGGILQSPDQPLAGMFFAHYFFQFSFASTATTILSGAIAERMKLSSYALYSFVGVLPYSLTVHWIWNDDGWLRQLGFTDTAGATVVHLSGGTAAVTAAWLLGPRLYRFSDGKDDKSLEMNSPVTALVGMFMLFWGWLGFNASAANGVSDPKWVVSAAIVVCTLNSAISGAIVGMLSSFLTRRKLLIPFILNSLLGGLVSITGVCAMITPWEALIVGAIGGFISTWFDRLLVYLKIDDPVGAVPVHFASGLWGTLAVGLFAYDYGLNHYKVPYEGLFRSGDPYLLAMSVLGAFVTVAFNFTSTFILLKGISVLTGGLRVSADDERVGADFVEHGIRNPFRVALEEAFKAVSAEDADRLVQKVLEQLRKERDAQKHILKEWSTKAKRKRVASAHPKLSINGTNRVNVEK